MYAVIEQSCNEIGQTREGCTSSQMSYPLDVEVTIDGKVVVADYGNHRVLIWDSIPESHGEEATTVLSQPDFTSSTQYYPGGTPTASNFSNPYSISSDLNSRLFVCGV